MGGTLTEATRDKAGARAEYRVDQVNKNQWRGGALEGALCLLCVLRAGGVPAAHKPAGGLRRDAAAGAPR